MSNLATSERRNTQVSIAMPESAGPSPSNMSPGGTLHGHIDIRPQGHLMDASIPRGISRICKEDYVWLSMPDNRASEVANDRLIKRDLSTPGIMSDGLRTRDLVNLPPKHCRKPGTVTVFDQTRRKPYGPLDLIKAAGRVFKALTFGGSKETVVPLIPPRVISRAECRHWKHGRVLKPRSDPRTKITKSSRLRSSLPSENNEHDVASDHLPNVQSIKADDGPRRSSLPEPKIVPQDEVYPDLPDYESSEHEQPDENYIPFYEDDGAGLTPPERSPHNGGRIPLGEIGIPKSDSTPSLTPTSSPSRTPPPRCHPCPFYPGEFHHLCSSQCGGYRVTSRPPGQVNNGSMPTNHHSQTDEAAYGLPPPAEGNSPNEKPTLFGRQRGFLNDTGAIEGLEADQAQELKSRSALYDSMSPDTLQTQARRRSRTFARYRAWYELAKATA